MKSALEVGTSVDRGISLARERYRLHRLLVDCVTRFDVESALEGPLDGVAGVRGVHGFGIARRGVALTSVVTNEEDAETARAIYQGASGTAKGRVEVAQVGDLEALPMSDLVISYDALALADDWRSYVRGVASRAKKAFVLVAQNPRSVASIRARLPFAHTAKAIETRDLAEVLWSIGRVREHVLFGFHSRGPFANGETDRFDFGPGRWVQLGGAGCEDDVARAVQEPSLFESAPDAVRTRAAKLQAFVVDVTPRTPQAKRKLLRTVS